MKYCDTTRGNGWTTGNTNLILNLKDPNLLARRAVQIFCSECLGTPMTSAQSHGIMRLVGFEGTR